MGSYQLSMPLRTCSSHIDESRQQTLTSTSKTARSPVPAPRVPTSSEIYRQTKKQLYHGHEWPSCKHCTNTWGCTDTHLSHLLSVVLLSTLVLNIVRTSTKSAYVRNRAQPVLPAAHREQCLRNRQEQRNLRK